jgi:hypothetical protein
VFRWVKGAVVRVAAVVFAWSCLLVVVGAAFERGLETPNADVWLTIARWTLFVVVFVLVAYERAETQRWLEGLRVPAAGEGGPVPPGQEAAPWVGERTEAVVSVMSFPLFLLWTRWGEPGVDAALEVGSGAVRHWAFAILLAVFWAMAAGAVAALFRSGLALGWARVAATPEAAARMANTARALPLFTSALAGLLLLPTLLGTIGLVGVVLVALFVPLALLWQVQQGGPTTELLVTLGPDDHVGELAVPLLAGGVVPERAVGPDGDTWVLQVPNGQVDEVVAALRADPENVLDIELNSAVSLDPELAGRPCRGTPAQTGGGVGTVAIIDTGVLSTHPALTGRVVGRSTDRHGHGTAMGGVAAAADGSVRILSLPALAVRRPAADDVADAIDDAVDAGVDVISMSFTGTGATPQVVTAAVRRALAANVAVVAAAGNVGGIREPFPWPANIPGVLVVTSVDAWHQRSRFSKQAPGAGLQVGAEGEEVCAPALDGSWQTTSGTSPATARVAGSIAAIHAACGGNLDQIARDIARHGVWTEAHHLHRLATCR